MVKGANRRKIVANASWRLYGLSKLITVSNSSEPRIIVGATICRRTAFVLDKFLSNQQEIQRNYPACVLIISTDEEDFAAEIKESLLHYNLKGEVVFYKTNKPNNARSYAWSIAGGREAVRKYALTQQVEYLLFVDCDIVFEPTILNVLKDKIEGYDVLWSAYRFPPKGDLRFAGGCLLIGRKIFNQIPFRCHEFKNELIFEDELFDAESFKHRARVKKGIFLSAKHFADRDNYVTTSPQAVNLLRRLANNLMVRYVLINASVIIRHNIPGRLHSLLHDAPSGSIKMFKQPK